MFAALDRRRWLGWGLSFGAMPMPLLAAAPHVDPSDNNHRLRRSACTLVATVVYTACYLTWAHATRGPLTGTFFCTSTIFWFCLLQGAEVEAPLFVKSAQGTLILNASEVLLGSILARFAPPPAPTAPTA